jgi:hypothetical protein
MVQPKGVGNAIHSSKCSDMAFAPGQRGGGIRNQLAITSQVRKLLCASSRPAHESAGVPVVLHQALAAHSCVAPMSQENSAVWLGEFDFDKMDFVGDGAYYHFPRNDHCDQIYCNVEVSKVLHIRPMACLPPSSCDVCSETARLQVYMQLPRRAWSGLTSTA